MKGVTFGAYHSYDDFSLILTSKEIAAPKTKTVKIDIEGADSALDFTEFFGEPKYEDCTHKFQFSTIVPQSEFLTLFSTIKNAIHGKKMRIVLDDDPLFYYVGRCFVSSFTNEKNVGKVSVECECEPWKYKKNETVVSATLDGMSNNLYNIDNVPAVGNVRKTDGDFFTLDVKNTGSETLFPTFRHSVYSAGEITPNQAVSLVLEIQSCEVSPADSVRFFFTSNFAAQPDYFGTETFSVLMKSGKGMLFVIPATIKDSATISNAALFIRSYFSIPVGASIKAKFRISVVQGTVNADSFVYVSSDGEMKGLRLRNIRKKVVPTITADSALTLYYEDKTYSATAGTSSISEIELKEGTNDIAVVGTGTVSFTYREGGL